MRSTARSLRVVSLVPSITETLLAWGVVPVACTRFCEQPQLAHVGGTKDPDVTAIVALVPDLVVVDEEENRREDAEALTSAGLAVHATHVTSLADVAPTLARLTDAVGVPTPPIWAPVATSRVISGAQNRATGAQGRRRRTAFVPIWRRPWMALGEGTYGASLLASLGIDVVPTGAGRYPTVDLDDVAATSPDLVLAPSEPYPFRERHVAELAAVAPVVLVDGQDLFWWGVRTPLAVARLSVALA